MSELRRILGLETVGKGATATIYRDGDRAIKLYIGAPPDEAEREAATQSYAREAGLPVPAVFGVRRLEENAVALEMQYIAGQPLLRPSMSAEEWREGIETLARLQCAVHAVCAAGLSGQAECLAMKIRRARLDEAPRERALSLLERLPGGDRLCHGDFHPLNILYDGEKHWIIDWVDPTRGNPLADACRSYVILKQHLTRSAGIYLRAFCKASGAKEADVLAWLPVVAAARLDESMSDKERNVVLRMMA